MNTEYASGEERSMNLWVVLAIVLAVAGIAVGGVGLAQAKKAQASLAAIELQSKQAVAAGEQARGDLAEFSQRVSRAFTATDQRLGALTQQLGVLEQRATPPAPPAAAARPPTSGAPPAEAPAPSGRVHVVGRGELLATIARKYGKTVKDFERANPGLDPNRIRIGQKLNVP